MPKYAVTRPVENVGLPKLAGGALPFNLNPDQQGNGGFALLKVGL
jgi:hypothetical protein